MRFGLPRALLLGLYAALAASQPAPQQAALVAFHAGLENPAALGWDTGSPLCGQYGVKCDGDGEVVALEIGYRSLGGTISGSLAQLPSLTSLRIGPCSVGGTIPSELGTLSSLQFLDINTNSVSGSIPSELGNLSELEELSLFQNNLAGTIPTSLGRLSKLKRLNLFRTGLSGSIPTELSNLKLLALMDLSMNGFSGTIPPELGDLEELWELNLNANSLEGTIPTMLGKIAHALLSLGANKLTGTIPTQLIDLKSRQKLVLSKNDLSGTIPTLLGELTQLVELRLGDNRLVGTIPTELALLTELSDLTVNNNRLVGTLPAQLQALQFDELMLVGRNNLCPIADYRTWGAITDYGQRETWGVGSDEGGELETPPAQDPSCYPCGPGAIEFKFSPSVHPTCLNGGACSGKVNHTFSCACAEGFSGAVCENGPGSVLLMCPAEVRSGAIWPAINALESVSAHCQPGLKGSPNRTCTSLGDWGSMSGTMCTYIRCPEEDAGSASWPSTLANRTATGVCGAGFEGAPARACSASGEWGPIGGSCIAALGSEPGASSRVQAHRLVSLISFVALLALLA